MFQSKTEKVKNWLTNWTIAIDEYAGNISESDGIYRAKEVSYYIKNIGSKYYVVVDDILKLEDNHTYHLYIEKEIEAKIADDIIGVKLGIQSGYTIKINELIKDGYKVDIYDVNNDGESTVAFKKGHVITNIETEFLTIELETKFRGYEK